MTHPQEAGKSTIDNYEPFGPEWEAELMKLPKKFIINMIREIKTNPLFAQQREQPWVRVEPGCEMPDYDDPVLWLCDNGNMHVEALDKDGNPWLFEDDAEANEIFGDLGNKATHWRKLPLPPAPPKD